MLLNEIKRIFEMDEPVLRSAIDDLGHNLEVKDVDVEAKVGTKPADVDSSLKSTVERNIINTEHVGVPKSEVDELTGTTEIRTRTLQSLVNLKANLGYIEQNFTRGIKQLGTEIGPAATAEGENGDIDVFIQRTLANLKEPTSSIRRDRKIETQKFFDLNRDRIVRAVMKATSVEAFAAETLTEIKNTLKSKEWLDGKTVKTAGIELIRGRIERFYNAIKTLQQNAANVEITMKAIKAKDATDPKVAAPATAPKDAVTTVAPTPTA
jgi:hypothetical protein